MDNLLRILAILLAACLSPGLAGQDPPPAPGHESTSNFRDKALHEESARPSGAFGLGGPSPTDTWLSGGEKTIKLVCISLGVLIVLRWLWKRRSVRYS